MKNHAEFTNLTTKERQILDILWDSARPMTATEISDMCQSLNKNTVKCVVRNLLTNNYIKVADIVYSGTVLCRRYQPVLSRVNFITTQLKDTFLNYKDLISKADVFASLISEEEDPAVALNDIMEMEKMLKEYKDKIQKR